jgi:nickel-dependent lactate racemase
MSAREAEDLLPRFALDGCRVLSHDASDEHELRKVGTTSRGTPLWTSRHYVEADARIVVGNVDPHQFAGFTGGAKGVVIGCGGLATIETNHSLMEHPLARMGISHGNPVREDIDEAGKLIGIDFVLNVVVNGQHEVVRAFAGALDAVSEESRAFSLSLAQAEFEEPADVVIASPGGYPKDINLYQAQKALAHASRVVRPGGTVVLVAECTDGIGDTLFERWMTEASSLDEIVGRFHREGFRLGAHKAYLFARDMIKATVLLVSSLPDALTKKLFFVPFSTLSEALEAALVEQGQTARIAILPRASAVVPVHSVCSTTQPDAA